MKILNFEIKRVVSTTKEQDTININFVGELLKTDLTQYSNLVKISEFIAVRLADELYPDVKDALLKHSGLQKIISEIRLDLAKKIIK